MPADLFVSKSYILNALFFLPIVLCNVYAFHNLHCFQDAPAHSYYAVFDGHSGVDAASYASAHLHVNIAKHPEFLTDTPSAIAQSFKITNDNFLKKCDEEVCDMSLL